MKRSTCNTMVEGGEEGPATAGGTKHLKRSAEGGEDCAASAGIMALPEDCFNKILLFMGDPSALHLCQINKQFRKSRRFDLEVLVIDPPDDRSSKDYPNWIHDSSLKEKFVMVINTTTKVRYERVDRDELYSTDHNEDNKSCHDVINSIPDKHAATITHLYLRAIRGRHVGGHRHADIGGKFPEKYEQHGSNLTSLKTLQVVQPPVGYGYDGDGWLETTSDMPDRIAHEVTNSFDSEDELEDALLKLCYNTRETLRALSIKANIRLSRATARWLVAGYGEDGYEYTELYYLELLVREKGEDDAEEDEHGDPDPFYMENWTAQVQLMAAACCPNLKKAPSVFCHDTSPPWPTCKLNLQFSFDQRTHRYPLGLAITARRPTHNNPNYYRRDTFLRIHTCALPDETAPRRPKWPYDNLSELRPPGFRGEWCGFLKHCVVARPFPEPEELRSSGCSDKVPYRAYRLGDACLADPENATASDDHQTCWCGWRANG